MAENDAQPPEEFSKMTMMEHLGELRRRLLWCVVALLITFGVAIFFAQEIFDFLAAPLVEVLKRENGANGKLVYTALYEQFFVEIKIGFYAAFFLAFPIFAIQIWKFVAPGLYKNERQAFLPFLIATPILFCAGAALVYYGIMPVAWEFFLDFQRPADHGQVTGRVDPDQAAQRALFEQL